jgi:hypothetical protein
VRHGDFQPNCDTAYTEALRRLQREQEPKSPFIFTSERGAPFTTAGSPGWWSAQAPRCYRRIRTTPPTSSDAKHPWQVDGRSWTPRELNLRGKAREGWDGWGYEAAAEAAE